MADRSTVRAALIDAYAAACRDEVEALKPGNVHIFADGHGMVVQQFLDSAQISAGPLSEPDWPIGRRILEAVRATRAAVGLNTNLGIVLLCAPLLAAAEDAANPGGGETIAGLRSRLHERLQALDVDDTRDVFAAIAHASPGGLGEAENDVRQPPRVDLLDAMRQAAARDRIAYQYVNGFADVFDVGVGELDDAVRRGETGMWPCTFTYLRLLTDLPDSHIARKWGEASAENVRRQAAIIRHLVAATSDETRRTAILMDFDHLLKADGLNPGTSADLTVACLLVRYLRDNLHIPIDDA